MNILKRLNPQRSTVGLDIGNHSLKLVKLVHQKEGYFLEATGIKELPSGTIEGSEVKNRDVLIDAIQKLVAQCDPDITDVVISMAGHSIISDKLTFKNEKNENTEEMILWEAANRSPFDVDDITLDYKILHRNMDTDELEVLLVAAKNEIMKNYVDLIYDAHLRPLIVDVDAFAINNCYSLESEGQPNEGVVALMNIGHDLTNVTFIKDGIYHSTRDISTAGEFFCKTLQRNLGVNMDDAMLLLKGKSTGVYDQNKFIQSIEYSTEELSSGIDLAFSYFKSSAKADTIDKIVLSGGGAYIPKIVELLEKRHQTSVQLSNPLNFLQYDPNLFGNIDTGSIGAHLTVAIGLALRKVDE
jgi:type IV pilus assembly protein PilM